MICVALGVDDALDGVVCGDLGRLVYALVVHEGTREGGGVDVACAVRALADLVVLVMTHASVGVDGNAGLALAVAHSGHDHGFRAEGTELFAELGDVCLIVAFTVFVPGEEGGLRDVGDQNVGASAKGLHSLHVVHVEYGVESTVVCHGGIHDANAILVAHGLKNASDVTDLLDAAQVAGVDRFELDVLLLPMSLNGGHIIGQIAEGESAEAARVGGEHGGGKDTGFQPASREDGEGNRQRALAEISQYGRLCFALRGGDTA